MYKLFCGNNVEILRSEVADNSIQLTVTSPPYDNLRTYNGFVFDFKAIAKLFGLGHGGSFQVGVGLSTPDGPVVSVKVGAQ